MIEPGFSEFLLHMLVPLCSLITHEYVTLDTAPTLVTLFLSSVTTGEAGPISAISALASMSIFFSNYKMSVCPLSLFSASQMSESIQQGFFSLLLRPSEQETEMNEN